MYQEVSWTVSLVLVVLVAIIFATFALKSSGSAEYSGIQQKAMNARKTLFFLILLVIIPIIGYTLTKMPYPTPESLTNVSKTVNVTAQQWAWVIDDTTAKVGEPVLYKVTSADVNHGFAVYDPDFNIISQTQAMPGYTNALKINFQNPGTYKILCLEYCGLAHHAMVAEITVTE